MTVRTRPEGFTGRHMLLVMLAFFGVIIAVNVLMATVAGTSWTGIVVPNSYVASQGFNDKVERGRRHDALGWHQTFAMQGGEARFALLDRAGRPVEARAARITFRRPVGDHEDRTVDLSARPDGTFAAPAEVGDGAWIVDVTVETAVDSPYERTFRIDVDQGSAR